MNMASTSAASVKKLEVFKNCQRLIRPYKLTIEKLQDNIFATFNEKDLRFFRHGYYRLKKLESHHKPLCDKFAECHQQCQSPAIEELIEAGSELAKEMTTDANQQMLASDPLSLRQCQFLMKSIIGFCLLEAKYYEALNCAWKLLQFSHFNDTTCWRICLNWALRLKEFDLLKHLLAEELLSEQERSDDYKLCIDCIGLAFQFHTANTLEDQRKAADDIAEKLQQLLANDIADDLFAQEKAILRAALVSASRLPKANVKKLGDPLYHREKEYKHYGSILMACHPSYFKRGQTSASIESIMESAEDFVLFCSAFANFGETYMDFCWNSWDVGFAEETERLLLYLWSINLTFGSAYWTLRPLCLLFHIRCSINTFEPHFLRQIAACIQALVTPLGASDQGADDANLDETIVAAQETNISKDEQTVYKLEAHVPECKCSFCIGRTNNWQVALEMEWLALLFQRFSTTQFQHFQHELGILQEQKIQPLRHRLFASVFVEVKTPKSTLPPKCYIHYRVRAVNQMFLLKRSTNEQLLNQAKELCDLSRLAHLSDWLLLRHFQRVFPIGGANDTGGEYGTDAPPDALADFQDYGHLFFREWRILCCQLLARWSEAQLLQLPLSSSRYQTQAWQPAFFQIEAAQPTTRQFVRTDVWRKSLRSATANPPREAGPSLAGGDKSGADDLFAHLAFRDSNKLKALVERLPHDITFVNVGLHLDGQMTLTRCHTSHPPIVLNVGKIEKDDHLLAEMRELLEANDRPSVERTEPGKLTALEEKVKAKVFWDERRRIDKDMELFLSQLQTDWLPTAAPFLLPLGRPSLTITNIAKKFVKENGFSKASALTIAHLLGRLNWQQCLEFANLLQQNEHRGKGKTKRNSAKFDESILSELRAESQQDREARRAEKGYLLLAVPSCLSHLPWECLPIFKHSPLVLRIPSLHFIEHLAVQKIPRSVDGRKSFHVLDPGGAFKITQQEIGKFIADFNWDGVVGYAPSREEVQEALTHEDLFSYHGHADGTQHWGLYTVRDCECRAVSILMGCSSVGIQSEGPGFDGRSSILPEYLAARCPCLIGCLWSVSDVDINRFFIALIEFCFGNLAARKGAVEKEVSGTKKGNSTVGISKKTSSSSETRLSVAGETVRLLAEGMVYARLQCKLRYSTGASVVAYGLPVVTVPTMKRADGT